MTTVLGTTHRQLLLRQFALKELDDKNITVYIIVHDTYFSLLRLSTLTLGSQASFRGTFFFFFFLQVLLIYR